MRSCHSKLPIPILRTVPFSFGIWPIITSSITDTRYYGQSYILAEEPEETEGLSTDYLGFIRSHQVMEMGDFLKKILHPDGDWYKKKNFLKAAPGTTQEYSNLNAALAAYIIEVATGVSFSEFTQVHIFQPLGMNSTSWDLKGIDRALMATPYFPRGQVVPRYALITYPDGGLLSSVADLSLYLTEMIKAYQGQSQYLKEASTRLLLPGDDDDHRAFWGMGEKSRNIGHGGSDPGAQTDMQFNADRKIGRIIFTNVNAEDNELLWEQYRNIHKVLAKYEDKI